MGEGGGRKGEVEKDTKVFCFLIKRNVKAELAKTLRLFVAVPVCLGSPIFTLRYEALRL